MKTGSISKLNAKIAIVVAAAGAIISIAFIKSAPEEKGKITVRKKVERPFKNVDVSYTSYNVSADAASVLTYATGSQIKIPAGAFVDEQGKPVTGTVQLKYREFHDPADFFMSGIPMTYDSAGTEYHFESAGMLEILAFQEGKPVFVSPDRHIVVEMASKQPEDKYNIYRFDTVAGNWNYVYKDKAGLDEQALAAKKKVAGDSSIQPVTRLLMSPAMVPVPVLSGLPPAPQLMNSSNYHFNLELDLKEFPELELYKGLQFEVKEGAENFDIKFLTYVWTDVELEKNNAGNYLMTLVKGLESHTFEVMPVLDAASYKNAYSKYKTLLAERRSKELLEKKKNDSLLLVFEKERVFQNESMKKYFQNMASQMQTQETIKRVFVISGFGIWNSDCPSSLPRGEQFAAKYVDSTGKKIDFGILYLVEKGRNAMFALYSSAQLSYNPAKKNMLWTVTKDNKLAILEEDDFKNLKKKNDSCTVVMKIIDKPITKSYEVKDILKIDI